MARHKSKPDPMQTGFVSDQLRPDFSGAAREKRLIDLAYTEAERRLRDGTASSEMICLFLRAGSNKEYLDEQEALCKIELAKAKTDMYKAQQKTEQMFVDAMSAFREYNGEEDGQDDQMLLGANQNPDV